MFVREIVYLIHFSEVSRKECTRKNLLGIVCLLVCSLKRPFEVMIALRCQFSLLDVMVLK